MVGLVVVAIGLPVAFAGVSALILGLTAGADTDGGTLVAIGLAALIPGALLVAAGIWVMARRGSADGPPAAR